ncbi:hypothetical protein O3P69_007521 [Scylla paramamosain]|uniref:Uncharacterized protein n=1 Tax=Scylla paramamosain TaxID=85552 RepID=A0AAW0V4R9_SCYPA
MRGLSWCLDASGVSGEQQVVVAVVVGVGVVAWVGIAWSKPASERYSLKGSNARANQESACLIFSRLEKGRKTERTAENLVARVLRGLWTFQRRVTDGPST